MLDNISSSNLKQTRWDVTCSEVRQISMMSSREQRFWAVQATFTVCSVKAGPHLFPLSPSLRTGSETNAEHTQSPRGLGKLDIGNLGEKPSFPGSILHRMCCIPDGSIMI